MFEIDSSAKVQRIPGRDMVLPAVCLLCGINAESGDTIFVDIHSTFDMMWTERTNVEDIPDRDIAIDGAIYFCMTCAAQIGYAAGSLSVAQSEEYSLRIATLEHEQMELNELREVRDIFNDAAGRLGYRRDLADSVVISDDDVSDSSSVSGKDTSFDESFVYGETVQSTDNDTESEPESGVDDSESDKSDSVDGSDDVNELTVNDDARYKPAISL